MKAKSLIVLLLAGIWGVASWWWYTCKVKGFCGADTAAQMVNGTAATGAAALAGADTHTGDAGSDKATDADKAKAEADKIAAADADKAAAEKAKADADKIAAEKAKADADKAAAADTDKAAAEKAKADADKAAADKAKADADKVTMETGTAAQGSDIPPATLHFPTGSTNPQLAAATKAYFETVAKFLKDNSTAKVTIVGHTDNKGDAAKNKALGLKRAELLQKTLIGLGAPQDRVTASSEGSDKPIADNGTEEGRTKNRRVEITPIK